ncbi:MAG TPA: hypothetical protein VE951_06385 [Candidatus Angelobacter sp.]|jgi:hypothetical protein|nr:hypothetical protein [Candidatus Angelobacter sp.]
MVDRELRRRGRLATVLACAVVSEEEIPAVRSQQPPGNLDIGEQPDDDDVLAEATPGHGLLNRQPCLVVNEGDPLFGQQDDQPPLTDDVQRL